MVFYRTSISSNAVHTIGDSAYCSQGYEFFMNDQINNTVVTWFGHDISAMSREELEVDFRQLGRAYQDELTASENRRKSSVDEIFKLAARRING